MRFLLAAAALVALSAGAASAEPLKLDEAALGDVAGGLSFEVAPIEIGVANVITTPVAVDTSLDNDLDLNTQVGAALAVNASALIAAFSDNINGMGASKADLGFDYATTAAAP